MAQTFVLPRGSPPNYPRFADAFVVFSVTVLSMAAGALLLVKVELPIWAGTLAAFAVYAALLALHLWTRRVVLVGGTAHAVATRKLLASRVDFHGRSAIDFSQRFAYPTRVRTLLRSSQLVLPCLASALASAYYVYRAESFASTDQLAWLIIFISAAISSTVGFAFSALAGSLLFHVVPDTAQAVRIMLVASISIQTYSVWKLRRRISVRSLAPYFVGGSLTVVPGVYLLLNSSTRMYLLALGLFLMAYAAYMLLRRPIHFEGNHLIARVGVGALGGITGATAAFPGAFITIWCGFHDWSKERQRAIYQPYILGMQVLTLIILSATTPAETMSLDWISYIIPSILGAYVGLRIFDNLSTNHFNKLVSAFLFFSGIVLFTKAL
jgi:uncharacterized membrane protein YfcA